MTSVLSHFFYNYDYKMTIICDNDRKQMVRLNGLWSIKWMESWLWFRRMSVKAASIFLLHGFSLIAVHTSTEGPPAGIICCLDQVYIAMTFAFTILWSCFLIRFTLWSIESAILLFAWLLLCIDILIVSVFFLAGYKEKNVSLMKLIASVFYIRYLLFNYVLNIDYVKAKIIYFVKNTTMSNILETISYLKKN